MKKVLLVLSIAVLILALTGCPSWFIKNEIKEMTIPEIKAWIDENNATDVNDMLVKTQAIVTYVYEKYLYAVDNDNNGIKVYSGGDPDLSVFKAGDKIEIVGTPYKFENLEYEIDLTYSEEATVSLLEEGVALPAPYVVPTDTALTDEDLGKLVEFTGKYDSQPYHYLFDNGSEQVYVFKYSDMPALTEGGTYTVMGVVGVSDVKIGDELIPTPMVFVWDADNVEEIETPVLPEAPAPGTVIISEIQYKPSGNEEPEPYEWVEVYNATDTAVNMGSVILTDGEGYFQFPADFVLGPGEFVVVGETVDATQGIDFAWDDNLGLRNSGEEVILHTNTASPLEPTEDTILCSVDYSDIATYGQSVYLTVATDDLTVVEDFTNNWLATPQEEAYMYFETTYNGDPAYNYGTPGTPNPGW